MTTNETGAIEKILVDFAKHEWEDPAVKPQIIAAIEAGEGGLKGFLTNALKSAPRPGGLVGAIFPAIENGLESYVDKMLTEQGAEWAYGAIDAELTRLASQVGG